MAEPIPKKIGRYEVVDRIAVGGMAELFLARQRGIGGFEKEVALKRVLSHLTGSDEFIRMLWDEARIAACLTHPNIVQIFDLGRDEDDYFIAMEYCPGLDLMDVIKRLTLRGEVTPPNIAARLMFDVCTGLDYAHNATDDRGRPLKVVHRDISPQNLLLVDSGYVKLVDFGIAKAATQMALTDAGVLKGKFAYMSPEQVRGQPLDGRTDLFCVGIVLYELLTGELPFDFDTPMATTRAIVEDAPMDIRRRQPTVPLAMKAIVDKALAKSVDDRWQTALDIVYALEDYLESSNSQVSNADLAAWYAELLAPPPESTDPSSMPSFDAEEESTMEATLSDEEPTLGMRAITEDQVDRNQMGTVRAHVEMKIPDVPTEREIDPRTVTGED